MGMAARAECVRASQQAQEVGARAHNVSCKYLIIPGHKACTELCAKRCMQKAVCMMLGCMQQARCMKSHLKYEI